MAGRVLHAMGGVASQEKINRDVNLAKTLLTEEWVALDTNGQPIQDAYLVFTPLTDRYRFFLQLPDFDDPNHRVLYVGETSRHRNIEDEGFHGQIVIPHACSTGHIWIDDVETDAQLGTYLPVTLHNACAFWPNEAGGPVDEEWAFRALSTGQAKSTKTDDNP